MPDNLANTIHDDENLAVAFDRVDKIPSPLLVIGLGGTGCDIVRAVKTTFAQRFDLPKDAHGELIPVPRRTAYLAIDSDASFSKGFDSHECINITNSKISSILANHDQFLTADERTWVHSKLLTMDPGAGAGTYRPAARLMLSRKFSDIKAAIINELKRISTVEMGDGVALGRMEIVICAGISGGTGSGTFLDIPQIIRHAIASDAMLSAKTYKITGYLVLPDISLDNAATATSMHDRIMANGFAALKELDFWMNYEQHQTPYTMEYGDGTRLTWKKPYDHCVLMSGTNVDGVAFKDSYNVVQKTVAENLLHYLANENKAEGDAPFSYMNYESNLEAMVAGINKPLPLNYAYRAIGAYAKRVPKKKLLYYEGSLLFETFMPPRDDQGKMVPNAALLSDGQTPARAASIVGSIGDMYSSFAGNNPFPAVFCNLDKNNENQMNNLRMMNPPPHDCYRSDALLWDTSVIAPAAGAYAKEYLKWVWQNFMQFCQYVISDPQFGPFSLLQYLTDANGLMPALRKIEKEWEGYAVNLHNNVNPAYDSCCASHPSFLKPPMLGKSKAVQAYLDNLTGLLDAVRLDYFTSEYAKAMNTFIKRVEEYVRSSLKPLCETIEALSAELVATPSADDQMSGDLFDVELVKDRIDNGFHDENIDGKISRGFLNRLCESSFETIDNVDPHGCGLTFTFAANARMHALTAMREEMNACFKTLNGQSLDAIMAQAGKVTVAEKNEYIDALGESVLNSARPLFSQDVGHPKTAQAYYSYLSIPDDSPDHLQRLTQTLSCKNVSPKGSSLRDHIYCTTAWDGLPIYRYSLIGALEKKYEEVLQSPNAIGTHLVWNGDPAAPYTMNWTKLPSPNPYYLFDPHNGGSSRSRNQYEEAKALVERALDAGQLTVDMTTENPVYTLRVFYADAAHTATLHVETIKAQVEDILTSVDPLTGAKRTSQKKLADLNALLAQADARQIAPQKNPEFMAAKLGILGHKLNPFDTATRANPVHFKEAQANFEALCGEFAVCVVLQQPVLCSLISEQIEAFETIAAELKKIEGEGKLWELRVQYAETFARMIACGLINFKQVGATFVNSEGIAQAVETTALLREDLKNERRLVRTIAYLADLPKNNEVRSYLEGRLALVENDWNQRGLQDALTSEEIAARVAQLDKLLTLVTADLNAYRALKTTDLTADIARLNNCIALLTRVETFAKNEKINYSL